MVSFYLCQESLEEIVINFDDWVDRENTKNNLKKLEDYHEYRSIVASEFFNKAVDFFFIIKLIL